jgi:hypothetical protein
VKKEDTTEAVAAKIRLKKQSPDRIMRIEAQWVRVSD